MWSKLVEWESEWDFGRTTRKRSAPSTGAANSSTVSPKSLGSIFALPHHHLGKAWEWSHQRRKQSWELERPSHAWSHYPWGFQLGESINFHFFLKPDGDGSSPCHQEAPFAGGSKSSCQFFCNILWKNLHEFLANPIHLVLYIISIHLAHTTFTVVWYETSHNLIESQSPQTAKGAQ